MANANIQRLLTDFGQQSREDQAGSTFGSRMAAAGRGFGQGMITNLGRAGAQSGIKAFENMDMRPASEKLSERLGKIDRTTPEGQAELIQIVSATKGTDAGVALQTQFAREAEAKLAQERAEENQKKQDAFTQQKIDEQVRQRKATEQRNQREDERRAVERSAAAIRAEKADVRADRALELQEEAAARVVSAEEVELDRATTEALDRGNRRALYIDAARDRGFDLMADALEVGGMKLEDAETLLYKSQSSNAQLNAPSKTEIQAMGSILDSPAFKQIDAMKDLPTGVVFSDDKKEGRRAVMYKAKQLMLRDRNLTIESALAQATTAIAALYGYKKGDGGGTGGTGGEGGTGDEPQVNPDGTFDASNVKIGG